MTEPSPIVSAADTLIQRAQTAPTVVFAIIAIVVPLLLLAGCAALVVKWLLPAWRDEGAKNRQHLAELVAQRGKEASEDIAAQRELARVQQDAIVSRVEAKIDVSGKTLDRVHDKLDKHGDTLTRIAAKLALPTVIGLIYLCGAASGFGAFVLIRRAVAANECPKGCSSGQHCCGDNKCCEDKTAKAIQKVRSSTGWPSYASYAQPFCSARFSVGCSSSL